MLSIDVIAFNKTFSHLKFYLYFTMQIVINKRM